jgi:hypothetical protein
VLVLGVIWVSGGVPMSRTKRLLQMTALMKMRPKMFETKSSAIMEKARKEVTTPKMKAFADSLIISQLSMYFPTSL